MKTRYRRISNGHWDFLQYEKEVPHLIFFKKKKWFYVPRPYYDTFWGRSLDSIGDDTYVNSLKENLDMFAKKLGNIEDYFEFFNEQQAALVQKALEYQAEIEKKRGTVKNII